MRKSFLTASAAVIFLLSGCGTLATASPAPSKYTRTPDAISKRIHAAADNAREIVFQAVSLLKTKYTWGGKTPATGLDCSGFVAHVYREATGLILPGSAKDMASKGKRVRKAELKEGDLVFFNTLGRPRSHVGIYVGEGKFVHALNQRTGVRVDSLSDDYYAKRYEEARTLIH